MVERKDRDVVDRPDRFNVEDSPRYRLAVLSRLWTNASEDIYGKKFGISLSEWRILAIVGAEQPINAAAIADRGLLEKSHISRLVSRLLARGLIEAETDRRDARKSWLHVTEEGERLFGKIAEISLARDALFLDPLTPGEREALSAIVDKLLMHAPDLR